MKYRPALAITADKNCHSVVLTDVTEYAFPETKATVIARAVNIFNVCCNGSQINHDTVTEQDCVTLVPVNSPSNTIQWPYAPVQVGDILTLNVRACTINYTVQLSDIITSDDSMATFAITLTASATTGTSYTLAFINNFDNTRSMNVTSTTGASVSATASQLVTDFNAALVALGFSLTYFNATVNPLNANQILIQYLPSYIQFLLANSSNAASVFVYPFSPSTYPNTCILIKQGGVTPTSITILETQPICAVGGMYGSISYTQALQDSANTVLQSICKALTPGNNGCNGYETDCPQCDNACPLTITASFGGEPLLISGSSTNALVAFNIVIVRAAVANFFPVTNKTSEVDTVTELMPGDGIYVFRFSIVNQTPSYCYFDFSLTSTTDPVTSTFPPGVIVFFSGSNTKTLGAYPLGHFGGSAFWRGDLYILAQDVADSFNGMIVGAGQSLYDIYVEPVGPAIVRVFIRVGLYPDGCTGISVTGLGATSGPDNYLLVNGVATSVLTTPTGTQAPINSWSVLEVFEALLCRLECQRLGWLQYEANNKCNDPCLQISSKLFMMQQQIICFMRQGLIAEACEIFRQAEAIILTNNCPTCT